MKNSRRDALVMEDIYLYTNDEVLKTWLKLQTLSYRTFE
jgi:hypothetical protein